MPELAKDTVQHTLCMPLAGRMIAAREYPDLFPDRDAERIVRELGEDISGKALYRFQYMWMNCLIRQYNLAWEAREYLKAHPEAVVVEMGAGLSCLRRQMGNEANDWLCLDMPDVIQIRERHVPKGARERNVACDLNDLAWLDEVSFDPAKGVVFLAGGLFYYFREEQVRRLLVAMAERFPGGMIAFDAVSRLGLKGIRAEVRLAGECADTPFSLDKPAVKLEGWSARIVRVSEKDYAEGYLKDGYRKTVATKLFNWAMRTFHMGFMVHAEFAKEGE